MINKIKGAVWELNCLGIKDDDILIAMSELVERQFRKELFNLYSEPTKQLRMLLGVKIVNTWPYNEIVVYVPKKTCYYPELIFKIKLDNTLPCT